LRLRDDTKRVAIIEAFVELINTIGFHQTSISKTAKKAGVSPATIYIYFENKEDMMNKSYISLKQEMSLALLKNFDPKAPVVKESFKKIWLNILNYTKENYPHVAFLEQYAHTPLMKSVPHEEVFGFFIKVIEFLERGKKDKILKDISIDILVAFIFKPLFQIYKDYKSESLELNNDLITSIFDMTWDAISL